MCIIYGCYSPTLFYDSLRRNAAHVHVSAILLSHDPYCLAAQQLTGFAVCFAVYLAVKMAVLGKLSGKTLIHFGAAEMLGTILICYIIAVLEGHVKPWLPTISACGEHPPEEYIFRYGIVSGALLLVVLAVYIYTADFPFSRDMANVTMGVVGGLALGVVGVCAANEDNLVHTSESKLLLYILRAPVFCIYNLLLIVYFFYTACAVIFFVLEDFLLFNITRQSQGSSLPRLSVVIKATCTIIAWFTSIMRRIQIQSCSPMFVKFAKRIMFVMLASII